MRKSEGFAHALPAAMVFGCFGVGAALQTLAMRRSELSINYFLVLGLEAALALLLSIAWLGEAMSPRKVAGLALILRGDHGSTAGNESKDRGPGRSPQRARCSGSLLTGAVRSRTARGHTSRSTGHQFCHGPSIVSEHEPRSLPVAGFYSAKRGCPRCHRRMLTQRILPSFRRGEGRDGQVPGQCVQPGVVRAVGEEAGNTIHFIPTAATTSRTGSEPFDGSHDLAVGEAPGPVDREALPESLPVLGPSALEHAGPPQLA